jgi:hypothetical protein
MRPTLSKYAQTVFVSVIASLAALAGYGLTATSAAQPPAITSWLRPVTHPKVIPRRCLVLQADQQKYAEWVYQQPVITGEMRWHLKYDWACAWSSQAAANMSHVDGVLRARRLNLAHIAAASGINGIPGLTRFAWCVASGVGSTNNSTGESGGDFAINTGNGFSGGYQFTDQTWQGTENAMGVGWSAQAWEATPAEQTAAFNFLVRTDPGAWPNTVPPCLYLQ